MTSPSTPLTELTDRGSFWIYASLVERVQGGDSSAMSEMYEMFNTGVRFLLYRKLGLDGLDDKVHEVFVIITEAIRNGEFCEPERLVGYVHTVVRRQIATYIDHAVGLRRNRVDMEVQEIVSEVRPDPEREAIARQNVGLAMRV